MSKKIQAAIITWNEMGERRLEVKRVSFDEAKKLLGAELLQPVPRSMMSAIADGMEAYFDEEGFIKGAPTNWSPLLTRPFIGGLLVTGPNLSDLDGPQVNAVLYAHNDVRVKPKGAATKTKKR